MEKFKSFDQFIIESYNISEEELNEGVKEVITAGIISLMTLGGISAQTAYKINYDTQKEVVDSGFGKKLIISLKNTHTFKIGKNMPKKLADKTVSNLLANGWKLEASRLDTIYKEVIKKAPDTDVKAISLKFTDNAFFESGKFELTKEMEANIKEAMLKITEDGGQIMKIDIKSSTDKQRVSDNLNAKLKSLGFENGNKGLSQARSSSLSDFLVDQGISDTIINTINLSEQGEGEIDQSARYVIVDFIYIDIPSKPASSSEKEIENIIYVVEVSKTKIESFKENKPQEKSKGVKVKKGEIQKQKQRGALGCASW